jgi:biotin carboxyl carrier protein/Na+-transporting methylmalonyl-CoA/oxaloacetate decarboxylase gamma subunit
MGLVDALWIVLLGMAIIFAVLGVLLLAMMLLNKSLQLRKWGTHQGGLPESQKEKEAIALVSALHSWLPNPEIGEYSLRLGSDERTLRIKELDAGHGVVQIDGQELELWLEAEGRPIGRESPMEVRAPLPGRVLKVMVREGEAITVGQELFIIEAMKMQNSIFAPKGGVVHEVKVKEGDEVEDGQVLLTFGPNDV